MPTTLTEPLEPSFSLAERLAGLTSVSACYQCKKCSAGCPLTFAMDFVIQFDSVCLCFWHLTSCNQWEVDNGWWAVLYLLHTVHYQPLTIHCFFNSALITFPYGEYGRASTNSTRFGILYFARRPWQNCNNSSALTF